MRACITVELEIDASTRQSAAFSLSDAEVLYQALEERRDELLHQAEVETAKPVAPLDRDEGPPTLASQLLEIRILNRYLSSLALAMNSALRRQLGNPTPLKTEPKQHREA